MIFSTGTYLFLDADIKGTVAYVKDCARQARSSWVAATRIRDYVAGAIDQFQPENAGTLSFVLLKTPLHHHVASAVMQDH